jgi:hypothetical protein
MYSMTEKLCFWQFDFWMWQISLSYYIIIIDLMLILLISLHIKKCFIRMCEQIIQCSLSAEDLHMFI